jgi:hypothetical protein
MVACKNQDAPPLLDPAAYAQSTGSGLIQYVSTFRELPKRGNESLRPQREQVRRGSNRPSRLFGRIFALSRKLRNRVPPRNSPQIKKIVILLKKSHSKNQEKIFRSQKLCNARSELG